MKMTVEITMDNAAFHAPSEEDEPMGECGTEVARLLRHLANRVDDCNLPDRTSGMLVDYNGNTVGSWAVSS